MSDIESDRPLWQRLNTLLTVAGRVDYQFWQTRAESHLYDNSCALIAFTIFDYEHDREFANVYQAT